MLITYLNKDKIGTNNTSYIIILSQKGIKYKLLSTKVVNNVENEVKTEIYN